MPHSNLRACQESDRAPGTSLSHGMGTVAVIGALGTLLGLESQTEPAQAGGHHFWWPKALPGLFDMSKVGHHP